MKKLLLSLFVWFVWIISFWYCNDIVSRVNSSISLSNTYTWDCVWYCCIQSSSSSKQLIRLNYWGVEYQPFYWNYNNNDLYCFELLWSYTLTNSNSTAITVYNYDIPISIYSGDCSDCSTCDDPYTSLECQTEYNLIPVEDVDINYCVWNWLCPNECGSWTDFSWDLQYSNIYINSILHPWEENIFIDIPDYIQWDYSVDTWNFNLYVWSWYDMDYMNSIIKINSYRPTSSDFTNIFVSGLTLIFPYIFVLLLIIFMWKLIKRVFK